MPHDVPQAVRDREPARRRAIWAMWTISLIVAGVLYAGKAAEDRSAFIRWRHQVIQLWAGTNIWDVYVFPNPPIMPICLAPLMALPPVLGAMTWFALKAVMATVAIRLCLRMARGEHGPPFPWWAEGLVLLLSCRSLLSDLNHGNINILILFLVIATLAAWRRGYDVLSGLSLALAIALKVTPALFVPYFLYKRSWRTVGATFIGMALFYVIVPSIVLGPSFNGQCLERWWHRMLSPYLVGGDISMQEPNQSLGGVLTRLMVELPTRQTEHGYNGVRNQVHLLEWPAERVSTLVKGLSFGLVGLLAWLCRTRTNRRDDPRMLGEFALVVLTMLFASERTWKHHYVTLMLPYAYIVYRAFVLDLPRRTKGVLAFSLALSAFFIATTSSVLGGVFADRQGHELALAYGMFFWGAVVLYVATAWRVNAERDRLPADFEPGEQRPASVPSPHFAGAVVERSPHQPPA